MVRTVAGELLSSSLQELARKGRTIRSRARPNPSKARRGEVALAIVFAIWWMIVFIYRFTD
jgi:hypothetical protein